MPPIGLGRPSAFGPSSFATLCAGSNGNLSRSKLAVSLLGTAGIGLALWMGYRLYKDKPIIPFLSSTTGPTSDSQTPCDEPTIAAPSAATGHSVATKEPVTTSSLGKTDSSVVTNASAVSEAPTATITQPEIQTASLPQSPTTSAAKNLGISSMLFQDQFSPAKSTADTTSMSKSISVSTSESPNSTPTSSAISDDIFEEWHEWVYEEWDFGQKPDDAGSVECAKKPESTLFDNPTAPEIANPPEETEYLQGSRAIEHSDGPSQNALMVSKPIDATVLPPTERFAEPAAKGILSALENEPKDGEEICHTNLDLAPNTGAQASFLAPDGTPNLHVPPHIRAALNPVVSDPQTAPVAPQESEALKKPARKKWEQKFSEGRDADGNDLGSTSEMIEKKPVSKKTRATQNTVRTKPEKALDNGHGVARSSSHFGNPPPENDRRRASNNPQSNRGNRGGRATPNGRGGNTANTSLSQNGRTTYPRAEGTRRAPREPRIESEFGASWSNAVQESDRAQKELIRAQNEVAYGRKSQE